MLDILTGLEPLSQFAEDTKMWKEHASHKKTSQSHIWLANFNKAIGVH